ncbi:tudor domain-containing 6 [Pholidichthys leucotaenia]
MSSIKGLPTQGSDVAVQITKVHLHPLCVLVEFWGKFSKGTLVDYNHLTKEIQSPGKAFQDSEGNPGDQCLVEIDGTWFRSRIVSRNGSKYSVFLIDKGMTCCTTTNKLAWGNEGLFQLPPDVEFCVLANVLPLSPENRWSPVALEFLKSLSGKFVTAHVQKVLTPDRTLLLHIPSISTQMWEMGFAKKLTPDSFEDFVLMSLKSHGEAIDSLEIQPHSVGAGERLHKQELFLYPELPGGTAETVLVTEVINPRRIFCQLKVFSQELKKLTEQLTQCCEGKMSNCIIGPEMMGCPCAARGSDGRWYRSILQQVFPANKMVEVLNVDYGTKQIVHLENVRPLSAEFFRMPVVTYVCSLHGIIDTGVGWTANQIDYLRSLLLYKIVIAKFEYQSISEGVYYATLYGDDNVNINNIFDSSDGAFLQCDNTPKDYSLCTPMHKCKHPDQQDKVTPRKVEEKQEECVAERLPSEVLSLNSSYLVAVQHVSNPSEFWIQTKKCTEELDELMSNIYHHYKNSAYKDVVTVPVVGLCCAAMAEDGDFYRAVVTEVGETEVEVFFVDYGNTEVVDKTKIRTLPAEFKKLPRLALKCTLAGVRPHDGKWSQSASDFFSKAVTDKVLSVQVKEKCSDSYVVQLTDLERRGEQNLSTLMVGSGLAERADIPIQKDTSTLLATKPPMKCPNAMAPCVFEGGGILSKNPDFVSADGRRTTYKEQMFPIGSVLDVIVSCIETPNDFWCQLIQNERHLKMLMHDIQAHYADSEYRPNVELACVARHPDNGIWYRALVIHKRTTPHVDVLFVDYGQTETLSVCELRRICPEFLTLHGQAFRCSLLNPIDMAVINDWSEDAMRRFENFVETAASNFVILKCTIYAVMYSEQKIAFNIVDLETPFESICTSLANIAKSVPPKKASGTLFRLDTYYYSTHNVKVGTEEQVTVTCVNSVNHFFCQLEKNVDVMNDLKSKVNNLCHHLKGIRLPRVFGPLCFAKYTDGQWHRGQIKATEPALVVHFVDYGDTIEMNKSDLLPVPKEASDIMSVPVQAVLCSLSDISGHVPSEVNSWFETTATESQFRALVVAREPDGKLLVELYHTNTQVNAKLKKMFDIAVHTENKVAYQGQRVFESTANYFQKAPKDFPKKQGAGMENHTQARKKNNFSASKPQHPVMDEKTHTDIKPQTHVHLNGQKVKTASQELYRPPPQRQSCRSITSNSCEPASTDIKPSDVSTDTEQQRIELKSPGSEYQKEHETEKLPKLSDLPPDHITPGMIADVYVSHCNSPLSFYVQCVSKEDEIFSLEEKLNDPQSSPQCGEIKDLHPGDLVGAEFAEDSSWYRAVVREVYGSKSALVEYVDFGNTAIIENYKIGRLNKLFLQLSRLSTQCMLRDAALLGKEVALDSKVVSAFKECIDCSGKTCLKCHFIRQTDAVWEVSLEDSGVPVACKVLTEGSDVTSEDADQVKEEQAPIFIQSKKTEKSLKKSFTLGNSPEFKEGQVLEVYITSINEDQTFWCQSAETEELESLALSTLEVGDATDQKHIDPGTLSPGSPCIALFSDDHLWYRAEVVDRSDDILSVFFVDYGNKSKVGVGDVREMPSHLMEIPPQAFLCMLDGFDPSCGSWDNGAADHFFRLTEDKKLQMTFTKTIKTDRELVWLVQTECEGQVINKVMENWWTGFIKECKPDTGGLPTSQEQQLVSTVSEITLPKEQLEPPDTQVIKCTEICVCPDISGTDELADPHTAEDFSESASPSTVSEATLPEEQIETQEVDSTENCICSEMDHTDEAVDPHTAEELLEFTSSLNNSISSQVSIQANYIIESVKESITVEETVVLVDSVPCDSGIEETMPLLPDNKDEQEGMICNVNEDRQTKGTEDVTEADTVNSYNLNSPLDELFESVDETATAATEESLPGGKIISSFNVMILNPAKEKDDQEIALVQHTRLTSRPAVKWMQTKPAVPSLVLSLKELCGVVGETDLADSEPHTFTVTPPLTVTVQLNLGVLASLALNVVEVEMNGSSVVLKIQLSALYT